MAGAVSLLVTKVLPPRRGRFVNDYHRLASHNGVQSFSGCFKSV